MQLSGGHLEELGERRWSKTREFWRKKTTQQLLEVKEDTEVAEGRKEKTAESRKERSVWRA